MALVGKITREQAAIIGAYTGILAGPFSDMHEYIEKLVGRPVEVRELGNEEFVETIKKLAKADFLAILP
jgi:hypothetical protein